jgi:hypothetical protein
MKTKRKKTTGPFKVHIIESEAGWGQKLDRVIGFVTEAKAKAAVRDYNHTYNPPRKTTPEWYMYAKYVGYKGELA